MFRFKKRKKHENEESNRAIAKWLDVIEEVITWYNICNNSEVNQIMLFAHTETLSDLGEEISFCGSTLFVRCGDMPQLKEEEKEELIVRLLYKYNRNFYPKFENREDKQILKISYCNKTNFYF